MTITEKYGFKVAHDVFHNSVSPNYEYIGENREMEIFESVCKNLIFQNKKQYSMIELGSNQAYYSLLFKHIIGKEKTINIMVEPNHDNFPMSKSEFSLNNCDGVFYNRGIGNKGFCAGLTYDVHPITLTEIFKDNNLQKLDVLHCDIDGAEIVMINENIQLFKDYKVEYILLATHGDVIHNQIKQIFNNLNYKLIFEIPDLTQGDSFLVYHTPIFPPFIAGFNVSAPRFHPGLNPTFPPIPGIISTPSINKQSPIQEKNIKIVLNNSILDNINTYDNYYVKNIDYNHPYFHTKSGNEHYRLLSYLSFCFNNSIIIELGTSGGESAIALSSNNKNIIHTFDICESNNIFKYSHIFNIVFHIENILNNKTYCDLMLKSPLVFLDTLHDGIFEKEIYDFLLKNNFKGILLLDDISAEEDNIKTFPRMTEFWKSITTKKYNITKYGHFTGTGMVVFNDTEIIME